MGFSSGKPEPTDEGSTGPDGRFSIPVEFAYGRAIALMAIDKTGKLGGLVRVEASQANQPIEIKLIPLIRVQAEFTSEDPAHPLLMAGVYVMLGKGGPVVAQWFSRDDDDEDDDDDDAPKLKPGQTKIEIPMKLEVWLPPGDYNLQCYEPTEPASHKGLGRALTLKVDQPGNALDLGVIPLKLNALVQLYGKEPPTLRIKEARGVARDVKLADFKGKWVLLEFWATWCGPCVGRGIPDLIEIHDEHEADRDKFVILAVHGKGSDDLADVDKKLIPIVRDTWNGRALPFPILLDDEGQTFASYGVEGIPASVLIDPEGKVVRGGADALAEALPKIPIAARLPRALDRQIQLGLGPKGATLDEILEIIGSQVGVEIKLDPTALAKLGLKAEINVPLTISGQVSLRSWFDLVLTPFGLAANPGPDGFVVTTPGSARISESEAEVSSVQKSVAARIGRKLDGKVSFDFAKASLREVAQHFEEQTGENFVVDPLDRKNGRINLEITLTGQGKDVPLREALKSLLSTINLEATVRDEVVLIRKINP